MGNELSNNIQTQFKRYIVVLMWEIRIC